MSSLKIISLTALNLILLFPLYGTESKENKENIEKIFNHLSDRMYCIAESNGNRNHDIEKELATATKKLKMILESHSEISEEDKKNSFFSACAYGNIAMIELLLKAKCNIEQLNEGKQTPLMIAALCGNIETVKALIANGANIQAKDKHGKSPKDYSTFLLEQMKNKDNPFAIFNALPKLLIAVARYGGNVEERDQRNPFLKCRALLEAAEQKIAKL